MRLLSTKFALFDYNNVAEGIVLIAAMVPCIESDTDAKKHETLVFLMQLADHFALWDEDSLRKKQLTWSDRMQDGMRRPLVELLDNWISAIEKPQTPIFQPTHVAEAAPIFSFSHDQFIQLLNSSDQIWKYDDTSKITQMMEWIASSSNGSDSAVPFLWPIFRPIVPDPLDLAVVTDDTYNYMRQITADSCTTCINCIHSNCAVVKLCQNMHSMCAHHLATYVVDHINLTRRAIEKKLYSVSHDGIEPITCPFCWVSDHDSVPIAIPMLMSLLCYYEPTLLSEQPDLYKPNSKKENPFDMLFEFHSMVTQA